MLVELLRKDLMDAMKAKDTPKKEVLQMVIAGLGNEKISQRRELSKEEEIAVIAREVKQIRQTIDETPASREDIIKANQYKIEVLSKYLPKQMSEEDIRKEVEAVISEIGLTEEINPSDKGKIMKSLMPKVKGKADGKLVTAVVDSYIKK